MRSIRSDSVELHQTLPEFEHFETFNDRSQGSIQYYKILFHGSFGREWTVSGCENPPPFQGSRGSHVASIPTYRWLPFQYIHLPIVASDVNLPAYIDRPPDADMHIMLLAIGMQTRWSDQFTHKPFWHALLLIHVQPKKWRRQSIYLSV